MRGVVRGREARGRGMGWRKSGWLNEDAACREPEAGARAACGLRKKVLGGIGHAWSAP